MINGVNHLPDISAEGVVGATHYVDHRSQVVQTEIVSLNTNLSVPATEDRLSTIESALGRASSPGDAFGLIGAAVVSRRYAQLAQQDLRRAELIALPVIFVILTVAFLSLTAALLPLVLAIVSFATTIATLHLLSLDLGLSVFVTSTASAVALGLSIDYALFIVTRYREEIAAGQSVEQSLSRTMRTAGRAVLLSGGTIAVCLLALFAVGVGIFSSMAIGGVIAALVSVACATTLCPALIFVLGKRLDRLSLTPAVKAASRQTLWKRLARVVTAHPLPLAVVSILVLAMLALPLTSFRPDFRDINSLPESDRTTQELTRVSKLFGPGAVGPIIVMTKLPAAANRILTSDKDVELVWETTEGTEGWSLIRALFKTSPDSNSSVNAVGRIRERFGSLEPPAYLGGITGVELDLTNRVASRTLLVVILAVLAALIILGLGLKSILVPLKSVVGSLMSVGATLGVLVILYPSHGGTSGVAFFVPLFLFVLVFGLSVDYEVFLLSRIREAARAGDSNVIAVRFGLVRSARVITLAGVAVASVFAAFSFSSLPALRQLGIGVAIAVLLDITVVRCILIPSLVVLLGRWNWWFPIHRRQSTR